MNKANPNIRRGSITTSLQWETRKGLPTKIPKEVAILLRGLGALLVETNMRVGVLLERMITLHVVIRETR